MERITLAHGSGGRHTQSLIREYILPRLDNPQLRILDDAASVPLQGMVAFTTDSFVVNPLFFPGGDIGKLAVCGTINDLAVSGAQPRYLSVALIIEEGLPIRLLSRVIDSIARCARENRVRVVTGDTKVVEKGACDKIFINTSGVGVLVAARPLGMPRIRCRDAVIVTGPLASHGLAVIARRQNLGEGLGIKSDCAALYGLLRPLIIRDHGVVFMRDPTRGGVAAALNEIAAGTSLSIHIEEDALPILAKVRAAAELLGIDPLSVANEGNALLIVRPEGRERCLRLLHRHPLGRHARCIGTVKDAPSGTVVLHTPLGSSRIIDMPSDQPAPRIC